MAKDGEIARLHGNSGSVKRIVKKQNMIEWLDGFINSTGDYMPHKSEIHLPVGSIACLYAHYNSYCATRDVVDTVSYETLRRAFQHVQEYVKIPKTKQFTKCDECVRLDNIVKQAKTKLEKKVAMKNKAAHTEWQTQERKAYYRHRFLAVSQPEEYACIIIDGMDQNKTNVPRFSRRLPKKCDNQEQLGCTIIGALVHGDEPVMHYMPNDFKKDCNLTIQVLLNCIRNLMKNRRGKPWPKTLFIQLDGAGDNKNKHLLSLVAHLVKIQLFTAVRNDITYTHI